VRHFARVLHRAEHRAFIELQAHPQRYGEQNDRDNERHTPTPSGKGVRRDQEPASQYHQQAEDEAADDAGLDKAGIETALSRRRVFGNVNRRPAIFAPQRQSLCHAQQNHQDGRGITDCLHRWHEAHARRCNAHERYGDEESVLAPQLVTQISEQDRPQWPEPEADGKTCPGQQQRECGVVSRKKRLADECSQRAVNEEIVPFEHCARRRCGDDHTDFRCTRFVLRGLQLTLHV
jgi:hypothetical protein